MAANDSKFSDYLRRLSDTEKLELVHEALRETGLEAVPRGGQPSMTVLAASTDGGLPISKDALAQLHAQPGRWFKVNGYACDRYGVVHASLELTAADAVSRPGVHEGEPDPAHDAELAELAKRADAAGETS